LLENEKVDQFLATAFGAKREPPNGMMSEAQEKDVRGDVEASRERQAKR
jgi:hypothetical protein